MRIKINDIAKLFRLIGTNKFIRRFADFLAHGGKQSRVEVLSGAAKVMRDMEEIKALRIKRMTELAKLMEAAGFPSERIQYALQRDDELSNVSHAMDTLLHYIESGKVTLKVDNLTEADPLDGSDVVVRPGEPSDPLSGTIVTRSRHKPDALALTLPREDMLPPILQIDQRDLSFQIGNDRKTRRLVKSGTALRKLEKRLKDMEHRKAVLLISSEGLTPQIEERKPPTRRRSSSRKKKNP